MKRRTFLRLAASAAALPAVSRLASAQTYPARPVRLIVGFPAGSASDIAARIIGRWLSERLGRPFTIENRPGAASNMGTEAVVRASPDGYTLLEISTGNATNATLYEKLSFNFIRDIAPVAGVYRAPLVMMVNLSVPTKTVSEFIDYAGANPGKINMASAGNGSVQHVTGELFKMMAGVDLLHVPYRGNPLPDLLGGQVQIIFNPIAASIEYIRAGKLRALAVTTATRSTALPNIPTVGESVSGYEASSWNGIGAPRNTPIEIVDKLNREINAGLADLELKEQFAELGVPVFPGSPAEFGNFIAEETEKWAKVVAFSGAKPD